eukprot:3382935-Rhodomonas_salina.2
MLLSKALVLLNNHPEVGECDLESALPSFRCLVLEKLRDRWRHVLVDEWQDINAVQYCLVRVLAGERGSLFAVGDQVASSCYFLRASDLATTLALSCNAVCTVAPSHVGV